VIPLPDAGDGSRRRRRRRTPARSRVGRPGWQVPAAIVALVVALGAIAWVAVGFLGGDGGDDDAGSGASIGSEDAAAATASLVVVTDGFGGVAGVTVLAPAASGEGGTILHVPPGAMVEVPSFGLASLADAAADGSPELLATSLENLLGVLFRSSVVLDPAGVQRLLEPVGALDVTVDQAVQEAGGSGRIEVVFPAGTVSLAPADAGRFLAVLGDGTQLDRLVRHQAFWDAYLAALATAGAPSVEEGVDESLVALAAGEVRHQVLPVEVVSGTSGADELYRVPGDALASLVGRLFPDATPSTLSGERIRVQVLNGVGSPGIAQLVSPLLVPAGAQVALSDNADRFDYAVTQVVYYDDARRADAQAVRDALGVGELVKSLSDLDVVDVTVVIGADFVQARGGSNPAPSEGATP